VVYSERQKIEVERLLGAANDDGIFEPAPSVQRRLSHEPLRLPLLAPVVYREVLLRPDYLGCSMVKSKEPIPMSTDGFPARATGPWVFDKKYYFERYVSIFTRGIGSKWSGRLAYVDLFSGPGRSVVRHTQDEEKGSPLLSLEYKFSRYIFVDVGAVLSTLDRRLAGHPKRSQVTLIEGDCNHVISEVVKALPPGHLTLAFIDPTGLQIHFDTIERLVQNRSVDLLMTIQFGMGIRMNLPLYIQTHGAALTRFVGNSEWRQDADAGGSISHFARRVLDRYLGRLRRLGFTTLRDREIEVRTSETNLLLYFMVLASRHRLGAEFWRKATQIGPSGQRTLNL
jgi:three-Cys-motif partner protein